MKAKQNYITVQLLIAVFFISAIVVGCASGPQYIPEQLRKHPPKELVVLYIDTQVRDLYIDGTKVSRDTVFIPPGTYEIKFKVYGESDEWKAFEKSMNERGYRYSKYHRAFVRGRMTYRPLGVKKYDWNQKTQTITIESGRRYSFTELTNR